MSSEAVVVEPTFVRIVDNVMGAEGPVFDKEGNFYMVGPEVQKDGKDAGEVLKVNLAKKEPSLLCAPSVDGNGGIPAGCQADKSGDIYIADMRLGILHMQADGNFKQVSVVDSEGRRMQGCNDCSFDYNGNLWVTAPAGEIAPSPYLRSFEEGFGSIYCLTADRNVVRLDTGYRFPNGIAVSHTKDRKPDKLIVAETPTRRLWCYDIEGPGVVKNKTLWGKLPDCDCESGPDGMDFDMEGNLLVAHWGSGFIEVFAPSGGNPVQRIKCPFDKPSNLHFKPGTNDVYVTEHTNHALWHFQWMHKGMPQYCDV